MAAQPANCDHMFKILLLGDSGVGKSSILLRFSDRNFNANFVSTIGLDFKVITVEVQGKRIKLNIWDTAGQERYRRITSSYYRAAKAVVFFYDVTDASSFNNIRNWIANIEEQQQDTRVHKILVGNKSDVDEERRVVEEWQGQKLADEYGIKFLETSARTGVNVDRVFVSLAEELLEGVSRDSAGTRVGTVKLCSVDGDGSQPGCCGS